MLETAKKSPNYAFRLSTYGLLEKAFIPKRLLQPAVSGLERLQIGGQIFTSIKAVHTATWSLNIRRLKWMEELKITHLILLVGMTPCDFVYIPNDTIAKLNQWAYNDLAKNLHPKRIAVLGQISKGDNLGSKDDSEAYETIDIHSSDCKFTIKPASEIEQVVTDYLDDMFVEKLWGQIM